VDAKDQSPDFDSVLVLYIGGEGRSGSTVLAELLGNHDGFFPVGEIRGVWHALEDDSLCGCGRPFSKCDFWHQVGKRAFGGWDRIDVGTMLNRDGKFARHRRIPRLLMSPFRWIDSADLDQHREVLSRLYSAIKEESGCSVIVDSTKDPAYALILRKIRQLDLRFVHLVRDSRAVAYSWSKKRVEQPEYRHHPVLKDSFLSSRSSWIEARDWVIKNLVFHLLARSAQYRFLKYESLISDPAQELAHLLRLADQGQVNANDAEFEFLPFHMLGGNRVRFEQGQIKLRVDDEWKTKMPISQRRIVGLLTLPLLIAYGYVDVPVKLERSL
jgi:hypothetical protein